jgi:hypothetical protein
MSGDRLSEKELRRDMTVGIDQPNADSGDRIRRSVESGRRTILFVLVIVCTS